MNNSSVEVVRRLKLSGLTYKEIGDKLGFSRQRAQQLISIKRPTENERCEQCGSTPTILHCHHLNYETDEFVLVCISCHRKLHAALNHSEREAKFLVATKGITRLRHAELIDMAKRLSVPRCDLSRWVRKHGITLAMNSRNKHPWHKMDWSMKNKELSKVWGLSNQQIAQHRSDCHTRKIKKCACVF